MTNRKLDSLHAIHEGKLVTIACQWCGSTDFIELTRNPKKVVYRCTVCKFRSMEQAILAE